MKLIALTLSLGYFYKNTEIKSKFQLISINKNRTLYKEKEKSIRQLDRQLERIYIDTKLKKYRIYRIESKKE